MLARGSLGAAGSSAGTRRGSRTVPLDQARTARRGKSTALPEEEEERIVQGCPRGWPFGVLGGVPRRPYTTRARRRGEVLP